MVTYRDPENIGDTLSALEGSAKILQSNSMPPRGKLIKGGGVDGEEGGLGPLLTSVIAGTIGDLNRPVPRPKD